MATPMMPDAPEPQNRMMAPQGAQGPQMVPPGMMPGPNAMQGGPPPGMPPGPPGAPPGPPPSKAQIDEARQHVGAIVNGLLSLVKKPRGDLTKKDVYDAASTMIAEGAFPTPASKQELVVHLANLPDDEAGIRKFVGQFLLQTAQVQEQFHAAHGATASPNPALAQGAMNA